MLDTTIDLFSDLDPALVAAVSAGLDLNQKEQRRAVSAAHRSRHALRRAKSEAVLADVLPATLDNGMTYHVLSHGDVDSLTFLRHVLKDRPLDYCAVSTWCIAMADLEELAGWVDAGQIDRLDLYIGEIFPSQYPIEYHRAGELIEMAGGRLVVARNHSKVMLAAADDYWLVLTSSANVNTNPRIEQTVLIRDRAVFDFYKDFFDGLKTIDRRAR